MKIDRTSISPISGIQAVNRTSRVNRNNKAAQEDNIAVSDNAQLFQKLVQKAKELPDVREDKVKAVAERIAKGEFSLDNMSIAESILFPK